MKKIILSILVLAMLISLTACTEVLQMNQRLLVQGIGVDKSEDGFKISMQILNLEQSTKENKTTPKEVQTVSAFGETVGDAIDNIQNKTGKKPLFSQTLVLIIGKEAAKTGTRSFIDFFIRHNEINPSVEIAVSENKAEDILKAEFDEKIISAEEILSVLKSSHEYSSKLNFNFGNFINLLESYSDVSTHYVKIKKDGKDTKIACDEIAVFKEDKFEGVLDNNESKGYLILKGKAKSMTDIATTKEGVKVTYVISDIYNNLEIEKEKDKYKEKIKIKIKAYIDEAEKEIDLDETFEDIKRSIKERIQSLIDKVINKSMYEYKTDILSFFKKFSEKFPNEVSSKEDFISKFNYEVNLEVDLKLTK